jgi:hypothetical protein
MISQILLNKVLDQARETASHSWEYGTVFEALLEYQNPQITVFHNPFPGGQIPELGIDEVAALQYVKPFIQTDSGRLCEGNGKPLSPVLTGHTFKIEPMLTATIRFIIRSNVSLHSCSPPF